MKAQRNIFTRKLSILLVFAMLMTVLSITPASAASTYVEISNAAELVAFANGINSLPANSLGDYDVVLTSDIDMSSETSWSGIGNAQSRIAITGTFDGGGHEVTGISFINATQTGPKGGLFNYTVDFTVKNLKVSGSVTSNRFIGGIIGRQLGSLTMENCIADMDLSLVGGNMNSVGGLIGQSGAGQTIVTPNTVSITNCAVLGSLSSDTASNPVGGLVGNINSDSSVSITNSYAAASFNSLLSSALIANDSSASLSLSNTWYLSSMGPNIVGGSSASVSGANSFSPGALTASDLSSTAWKNMPGMNVFNGHSYPVLNWQ